MRHTKPGITGRTYPQPTVLPEINRNDVDYEEAAFGYKSLALQKVTPEQRIERERAYRQEVAKEIENKKISNDDINDLVASLITVTDYLEGILRGEDIDVELPVDEDNRYSRTQRNWELGKHLKLSNPLINIKISFFLFIDGNSKANAHEFLGCVKRWLKRAPNVIRGNIAPFTPTGDINDAIFIIHRSADDKPFERIYESFDHSPPDKYFSPFNANPGSYFNNEQSQDYFQKLIESNKPISGIETIIEDDETAWDTVSLFQPNNEDDEDEIDNEWKTPEEIRKIEELDNPNRIWKNTGKVKAFIRENSENIEKFIQQKIKNILELKELCEKSP